MDAVRRTAYKDLVDRTALCLAGQKPQSGLYVVDTLIPSPNIFPMVIHETDSWQPWDLRKQALEVARSYQGEALAVVFYHGEEPRLQISFLTYRLTWQPRFGVEIPPSPETLAAYREANTPRVVATD
jgi:hypothetical protein